MAKRKIAVLGVLLCLASAALWWLDAASRPRQANAQAPAPLVPVTGGTVVARDVPEYLLGIGTVQAFNTDSIKSQVDGRIVKVAFIEGDEVHKGDPLFQIDPRPYQAALAQAIAAREKDEAQLLTAQQDLVRYGKLVGSGFQTRQSFDQQQGQVAQFQAAVKGDEAQIQTAQLNLGYTDIAAPIDGKLGARLVDIGNLVRAADNTSLVTITQTRPIFVSFTLPQSDLDTIREHQRTAPLAVDALAADGKTVLAAGKLTLIDNMIDQATGTIHLKATFANQDERLWPGEFVNVRVVVRIRRNVATVPSQTVQEGPDGHYVYVIGANDTVQRRDVDIAGVQEGIAVVTKGLTQGERVVVEGQYRLTDGTRVKLLPPRAENTAG